MTVHRLNNEVRSYAWGSTSVLPALLGLPEDGEPKAELWLGAHPDSPSRLSDGRSLDAVIDGDDGRLIGAGAVAPFGRRLPYLLKVLSAAAPLSLQVHPDAEQAARGYADEQDRSVSPAAAERRYRDPFHKPEMVLALEPFDALCGLRDPTDTSALLRSLEVDDPAWPRLLELVAAGALREAVSWLLSRDPDLPSLVRAVARGAGSHSDRPEHATTAALAQAYPDDPGVLVALLLHRVTLAPGEALFLAAGQLHAYLGGTAVEVMASSDNVLRAGLTSKYVDVDELMRITDFTPRPLPRVIAQRSGVVSRYRPPAAEFELAYAELGDDDGGRWHELPVTGPRILLALSGAVDLTVMAVDDDAGVPTRLDRGDSVFVSAAAGPLALRGAGTAVAVGVPAGADRTRQPEPPSPG
jgi:mannose-6-phosphate isomerase